MQLNTKSIKSRFEKSMDKYNENAVVQTEMAEKLTFQTLKLSAEFDTILELGCGTGVLTERLNKNFRFKNYYANDLVEKSKNYVLKIIPDAKFIHGNALKIKPPQKSDLIISNAMFQWFSNLEVIIKHCKLCLNQNGILAFSTFGTENFCEIKDISGLSLRYLTKDEIFKILEPDFEILYFEDYIETLEFKNPPELLAHMKNTGVNSLAANVWTIKEVKLFCEKYLEKYKKTKLTYNPIIIIAKIK